jgi:arginine exporter protein ArgO
MGCSRAQAVAAAQILLGIQFELVLSFDNDCFQLEHSVLEHNIWTSAILAVVISQILWIAIVFGYGFETAAQVTSEYLWYLVGALYALFLAIRAPRSSSLGEGVRRQGTEPDA